MNRTFRTIAVLSVAAMSFAAAHSQATANSQVPPLLLGAAWYPEQWPESRWEADLALMEKAHLHVVRVGEFAWSSMEPTEGHYDLDWLERAINLAGKHGIYTVLGTPTATPPAWLTAKYPETLRIDENGHRDEHGNRLQYDWSNPKYRALSRAIVEQLATRFGHNPYVVGWQLDNEVSQISTSVGAQKQFQDWLQKRYGTLDNLNTRWTTAYWSQSYTDWSQIHIPKHGGNPGLMLGWKLFVSDTWRSYLMNQIDVIRPRADARQFITTNTMGFFDGYDHYITEDILDLAAWDDYVPNGKIDPVRDGMAHDITRGFKRRNFWIMETQPGFVNWSNVNVSLKKGDVRALAWHDTSHTAPTRSATGNGAARSTDRRSTTERSSEPTDRLCRCTRKCKRLARSSRSLGRFSRARRSIRMLRSCIPTRAAGPSNGRNTLTSSIPLRRWDATTARFTRRCRLSTSFRRTSIFPSTNWSSRLLSIC